MAVRVLVEEQGLARRVAEVLALRLGRRLGEVVTVTDRAEGDGPTVLLGTPESPAVARALAEAGQDVAGLGEGYLVVPVDSGDVLIAAAGARGLLPGAGALLRAGCAQQGAWSPPVPQRATPALPVRPIYFATHFGNWYAHAPLEDVQEYVEDLALEGYNELVTWFDTHHYRDLDDGREDWDRLSALDAIAHGLGLRVGRIAIVNESFEGQAPSELQAVGRLPGTGYETDLCPSRPEARALLLANRRAFLERVRDTTRVDWICLWPYDQGGCSCADCAPWPRTYLELGAEIAALVEEVLPGTELVVSAWWIGTHVEGEDEALFAALESRPAWFRTVMAGTVELRRWLRDGRALPEGYGVLLFPEISMFDALPWGGRGANPAPRKFAEEMRELGPHLVGAMPYSEGRYEDVNKVVWARLQWDPALTPEQLAREYAVEHLGPDVADEGAALLLALEEELRDLARAPEVHAAARRLAEQLQPWAREGWRWQVVAARAELDGLRARLDTAGLEPAARQDVLDRLRATYEHLQHEISRHDDRSLWGWIYLPFEQWLTLPFNELRLPTARGDVFAG